jgi:hypothetical protein
MNVTLNILQIETHPGAHEEYLMKGPHVEAAAFMRGGRSALALCERVPVLITRFPGFPVQLGGSGALLAAFLNESRIRGRVQCRVQEIRV